MQNDFSLSGKTIVVTGASSGIGRACAITCNSLGANVLILGRNIAELQITQSQLAFPDACTLLAVDLTHYDEVVNLLKPVLALSAPINGVIHAAGISTTLPFRNISPEKINHFFEVNVTAALHLSQLLLKPSTIAANGASIVFLTSVMAQVGESAKVLYSMTKGALLAASRSMAIELAPKKIRVNCIAPGVVVTPMTQNAYYSQNEELRNRITSLHPLGVGEPGDIANACVYLLSDASRWITGTQLVVDGGYTAR